MDQRKINLTSQRPVRTLTHVRWETPSSLYQSYRLIPYSERLICGFTAKPLVMGGATLARDIILQHRRLLCESLGVSFEALAVPSQVHGDQIARLDRLNREMDREAFLAETDAVIVTQPQQPVMLIFADCVPVVLYAPEQHMGAVIHAGWRGTAQSIVAKTVEVLRDDYKILPETLIAVIGPSIGGCCYEVSEDVHQAVSATLPQTVPSGAYMSLNENKRPQVDLKQVNRLQLEGAGVSQIEVFPDCTHCEGSPFWSYRRGDAERLGAFLCLL